MRFWGSLFALMALAWSQHAAAAKAVFAHFMVDNAQGWDSTLWGVEMDSAIGANIDAFALNIAAGSPNNAPQLANAFAAANNKNFKLFFSFDYAGNGAWLQGDVQSLLTQYAHDPAYFQHEGSRPLVSTFEGPDNAADWIAIKANSGCFFIPDWSSVGAGPALALANGVADGLFSWAAWPWGGGQTNTYVDASYLTDLKGKPYMMAASPWFYTNMPGYGKNWMWPHMGMTLWPDRWTQILALDPQPLYVEIISWNDFGESHYISNSVSSPPFETDGIAQYDYVSGMSHEALQYPLAVWAQQFKTDVSTVTDESITLMYLLHDASSCNDGNTPVNTATQLQFEYFAQDALPHRYIGYIATLTSPADITISVGGHAMAASFSFSPPGAAQGSNTGGAGVYYGSVYVDNSYTGTVTASLSRNGAALMSVTGKAIGGCTSDGYANFNLYVTGDIIPAASPTQTTDMAEMTCIAGTGATDFLDICSTACEYGYCPYGACVCTAYGWPVTKPKWTGAVGHALTDWNYEGLCSFVYPYGFTFPEYCGSADNTASLTSPTVSPFLPFVCTGGTAATTDWTGFGFDTICAWTCAYGYCPIHFCTCTGTGSLLALNGVTAPYDTIPDAVVPDDADWAVWNLCIFICQYGACVCMDEELDPACDFSLSFPSLDALSAASSNYSDFCNTVYALDVLINDASTVLTNYTAINTDYDSLFGYYVTYVYDMIPSALNKYLYDDTGLAHFTCYFSATGSADSTIQACPNLSDLGNYADMTSDTTVDVVFNNETGFWSDLANKYGVEQDWISRDTPIPVSTGCSTTHAGTNCDATMTVYGFPQRAADPLNITNPKDIFAKAGPALAGLPDSVTATLWDVLLGQWNGSVLDPVSVVSLPIAMAQQALESMSQVKAIGQTEEDSEKADLIGFIVTAVLSIVPFVGEEVAAAAGLAQVARAANLVGLAANLGYDIYAVVENPSSAPMVMLGELFGIGGIAAAARDAASYARMASLRREMSDELSGLGTRVTDQATTLQKITKSCNL